MKRFVKLLQVIVLIGICLAVTSPASHSLIGVHPGNDPMEHDPGFPTGSLAIANLESRLGFHEGPPFGGGEYHFSYQCKATEEFNKALELFNKIQVPNTVALFSSFGKEIRIRKHNKPLLLVVHDAPKETHGLDFDGKRVDWTFNVFVPASFHRLFNSESSFQADHPAYRQSVPPPRIDVYVGDESPIQWDDVVVPEQVRVFDMRKTDASGRSIPSTVRGQVFDMTNHQVIAGALVSIVKHNRKGDDQILKQVKTDEQGKFVIKVTEEGRAALMVKAEGYVPRHVFGINGYGQHAEWDVTLLKGASLEGVVMDTEGNPLNGITVELKEMIGIDGKGYTCAEDFQVITDDEGYFKFDALPYGSVRLNCVAKGMHQKNSILERYKVTPYKFEKPEKIVLVLDGTGTIKGKITDGEGNPPERPAIVELEPEGGNKIDSWGGSMMVKEDGTYEFKGVPPGVYYIKAMPNPRSSKEVSTPRKVTVNAGETYEVNIKNPHVKAK